MIKLGDKEQLESSWSFMYPLWRLNQNFEFFRQKRKKNYLHKKKQILYDMRRVVRHFCQMASLESF